MKFTPFNKIARYSRECVITEKIDGTNASIVISEDGDLRAGSRNRWITPEDDNYGFARWVEDHKEDLLTLGPRQHFGEWWGQGIQRGYGLTEKRFSLFNVHRWGETRPECCHVVPTLYRGVMNDHAMFDALNRLQTYGSLANQGFGRPEGIVIFHSASGVLFKKTLDKDDEYKGKQ